MNSISTQPTGACIWLQQALAVGAVESARIKALAETAGVSPKALRTARERLGVLAKREGNGTAMRSIWSLPAAVSRVVSAETVMGQAAKGKRVEGIRAPVAAVAQLLTSVKDLTDVGITKSPSAQRDDRMMPTASASAISEAVEVARAAPVPSKRWRVASKFGTDQGKLGRAYFSTVTGLGVQPLDANEHGRTRVRIGLFVQRGLDRVEAKQVALALIARDRGRAQATGSCVECQNFVRQECPAIKPVLLIHECWSRRHDGP